MNRKALLADYLSFSRRDRIGILALLAVVIGVFLLPTTLSTRSPSTPVRPDTTWIASLKRLEKTEAERDGPDQRYKEDNSPAYQDDRFNAQKKGRELFYFDPNTLSADGWQQLGLREKTIRTIQNYRDKGGKFRTPEDLQKIYGLFPDEFARLAPFITIGSGGEKKDEPGSRVNAANGEKQSKIFTARFTIVDINTADTSELIALPGIGSKLASRIIHFRDKLGGFYSVSQVGETFGLPDSTFQKIKPYLKLDNAIHRKININKASLEELKAHPYIRYNLASPIIAYRDQHGSFVRVEDIRKVFVVTDEIYDKIAPYLATE